MNATPPATTVRLDRLNALGQLAVQDSSRVAALNTKAKESAELLWRELLYALLEGVDLEDAVRHAGVFGDAVGPLNIRERQAVADALKEITHGLVYPASYDPEQDRPGQTWTADEGDGIPPDAPAGAGVDRALELRDGGLHEHQGDDEEADR